MKSVIKQYFVKNLFVLLSVALLAFTATNSWSGERVVSDLQYCPYNHVEKLKLTPERTRQIGQSLEKKIVSLNLQVFQVSSNGNQKYCENNNPYQTSTGNVKENGSFKIKIHGLENGLYYVLLLAKAEKNGHGSALFYWTDLIEVKDEPTIVNPIFKLYPEQRIQINVTDVPGNFSPENPGFMIMNYDRGSQWIRPAINTDNSLNADADIRIDQKLHNIVVADENGENTTIVNLSGVDVISIILGSRTIQASHNTQTMNGGITIDNISFEHNKIQASNLSLDFSEVSLVYIEGWSEPKQLYFILNEKRYPLPMIDGDTAYSNNILKSWGRSREEARSMFESQAVSMPLIENATIRPGMFFLKTADDETIWEVYAEKKLRKVKDQAALEVTLGYDWRERLVIVIPNIFLTNYQIERTTDIP